MRWLLPGGFRGRHFAMLPAAGDTRVLGQVVGAEVVEQRGSRQVSKAGGAQHRYPVELAVGQQIGPTEWRELEGIVVLDEKTGRGKRGRQRVGGAAQQLQVLTDVVNSGGSIAEVFEESQFVSSQDDGQSVLGQPQVPDGAVFNTRRMHTVEFFFYHPPPSGRVAAIESR